MQTPQISILIPAYNEASVIARSLAPLADAAAEGLIEVIVVANGCTDGTEQVAQRVCPAAQVLSIGQASKPIALNLAATHRRGRVVICLDADLELSLQSVLALAQPLLAETADLACARMIPRRSASALVRAFYRAWQLNPYFDEGKAGGVIALSDQFAGRVFPMDPVTSDDEFVARSVPVGRRVFVKDATFRVYTPDTLADLLAIRRRSRRGTAALERAGRTTPRPTGLSAFGHVILRALRRPARLKDVAVYAACILWVRLSLLVARTNATHWERDLSSRVSSLQDGAP